MVPMRVGSSSVGHEETEIFVARPSVETTKDVSLGGKCRSVGVRSDWRSDLESNQVVLRVGFRRRGVRRKEKAACSSERSAMGWGGGT